MLSFPRLCLARMPSAQVMSNSACREAVERLKSIEEVRCTVTATSEGFQLDLTLRKFPVFPVDNNIHSHNGADPPELQPARPVARRDSGAGSASTRLTLHSAGGSQQETRLWICSIATGVVSRARRCTATSQISSPPTREVRGVAWRSAVRGYKEPRQSRGRTARDCVETCEPLFVPGLAQSTTSAPGGASSTNPSVSARAQTASQASIAV